LFPFIGMVVGCIVLSTRRTPEYGVQQNKIHANSQRDLKTVQILPTRVLRVQGNQITRDTVTSLITLRLEMTVLRYIPVDILR
jgi:hypothetical protein